MLRSYSTGAQKPKGMFANSLPFPYIIIMCALLDRASRARDESWNARGCLYRLELLESAVLARILNPTHGEMVARGQRSARIRR